MAISFNAKPFIDQEKRMRILQCGDDDCRGVRRLLLERRFKATTGTCSEALLFCTVTENCEEIPGKSRRMVL